MKIIIVLFSTILDYYISSFLNENTLFLPLLTLITLYLIDANNTIIFIIGLIYDILYTNVLFFDALIYLFSIFLVRKINFKSKIISSLILIINYRVICYLVLLFFNNIKFDLYWLIKNIYSSLIVNIIYMFIFFLFFDIIKKKKRM